MSPPEPAVPPFDAWGRYARGLEVLGTRLGADDFPVDDTGRAEALLHLAQQTVCWLEWAVSYGDPAAPAFQRQNDLVTPWGGSNADNVYRHARISSEHTYRIQGRMHSCQEFALAIREGFRHTDRPATVAEITASDIGIHEGEDFEVLLGGSGDEPNRVPVPDGAVMCSIREYYFDWRPLEPATFTIERTSGPAPRAEPSSAGLEEALDLVERSIVYWNDYMSNARARQDDNSFGSRVDVPRGLRISQFAFCFYDLAPDEALVVEAEVPDARYWSLQLYGLHFFRPLDLARPTSLNHRQAHVAGSRIQVVVAHQDPGVPNWLDTTGRATGLLNYRHFWGSALPDLHARVVPFADVRSSIDGDTPEVRPAQREEQLRARRDHLAWRFRT